MSHDQKPKRARIFQSSDARAPVIRPAPIANASNAVQRDTPAASRKLRATLVILFLVGAVAGGALQVFLLQS